MLQRRGGRFQAQRSINGQMIIQTPVQFERHKATLLRLLKALQEPDTETYRLSTHSIWKPSLSTAKSAVEITTSMVTFLQTAFRLGAFYDNPFWAERSMVDLQVLSHRCSLAMLKICASMQEYFHNKTTERNQAKKQSKSAISKHHQLPFQSHEQRVSG